jgi:hypothetical protein
MGFKEEIWRKRDCPKQSKGKISAIDQERHTTLDILFQAWNTSEKRSVETYRTPEDWSPDGSQPLAVGETRTVVLPRRVLDLGFG